MAATQYNTTNIAVPTLMSDSESRATIRIVGQYVSAQSAQNTYILQANTLKGANNAQSCIVSVTGVEFATSIANGWVSLEYISANTANASNATIVTLGRNQSGKLSGFFGNPLGSNATGDIQLNCTAMEANDSFTINFNVQKDSTLPCWSNLTGVGAGSGYPYN